MLQYFVWLYSKGPFQCPQCGGWNTDQSAKTDYCNDCGYIEGYQ